MMGVGTEYKCAACGETFVGDWSDEEQAAEAEANYPGLMASDEPKAVICDDCYKAGPVAETSAHWKWRRGLS